MSFRTENHTHVPVYRVTRAGWADPLDATFSQKRDTNRWNTAEFPALYCCCSIAVARAVTRDLYVDAAIDLEDLQPAARPTLSEIEWRGKVVDVASSEGLQAAGLPRSNPAELEVRLTQPLAAVWHSARVEGVLCRSASLARLGFVDFSGDHQRWGELAIFVANSAPPSLASRLAGQDWLLPGAR